MSAGLIVEGQLVFCCPTGPDPPSQQAAIAFVRRRSQGDPRRLTSYRELTSELLIAPVGDDLWAIHDASKDLHPEMRRFRNGNFVQVKYK